MPIDSIKSAMLDYLGYTQHSNFAEQYAVSKGWGVPETNAFAHAYVSAMLTINSGAILAQLLGDFREDSTTWDYYAGQKPDYRTDTFRDLYNNAVGREIGKYAVTENLSQSDVVALIEQAMAVAPGASDAA